MGIKRGAVGGTSWAGFVDATLRTDAVGTDLFQGLQGEAAYRARQLWNQCQRPALDYPVTLFQRGEQGVWYDPSDFSTMFQDAAGTRPVTRLGQPVGLILDKSGNGNHARQSSDASRPTVEARSNLLTRTEEFNDAAWNKSQLNAFGSGSVANTPATTDPIGSNAADYIQENTANNFHLINLTTGFSVASATAPYTFSVYVKAAERSRCALYMYSNVSPFPDFSGVFDLSAVTATGAATGTGVSLGATIESVGNGWYRCAISGYTNAASTTNHNLQIRILDNSGNASYTGTGTSGLYLWGAQLELGSTATQYQRVVTASEYNDIGLPRALRFDGTDDALATDSINFTATDEMTVSAGVFKGTDATTQHIAGSQIGAPNPYFVLQIAAAGTGYSVSSFGTVEAFGATTGDPAPISNVVSLLAKISAPSLLTRVNSVVKLNNTSNQGVGFYANTALYLGRRNNVNLPLNGRIHQLIIRSRLTNAPQLTLLEQYIGSKTGVVIP